MNASGACPCGSGETYGACCGPLHQGAPAPTAVALMRSRYSAYTLKLSNYLLSTWHPSSRPRTLDLTDGADGVTRWLGLVVKSHGEVDDGAMVEFVARYKSAARRRSACMNSAASCVKTGSGCIWMACSAEGRTTWASLH